MSILCLDDDKLEKVCQGFSLLDDADKMFILGIVEGLVFAKEKIGKLEAGKYSQRKIYEKIER